jgi:hypothetical protein
METHRQQDDLISLLLFFQNGESRLKLYFSNIPIEISALEFQIYEAQARE